MKWPRFRLSIRRGMILVAIVAVLLSIPYRGWMDRRRSWLNEASNLRGRARYAARKAATPTIDEKTRLLWSEQAESCRERAVRCEWHALFPIYGLPRNPHPINLVD